VDWSHTVSWDEAGMDVTFSDFSVTPLTVELLKANTFLRLERGAVSEYEL
jgi:hypothetical protein